MKGLLLTREPNSRENEVGKGRNQLKEKTGMVKWKSLLCTQEGLSKMVQISIIEQGWNCKKRPKEAIYYKWRKF
jgi:hypothetical protein